MSAFDIELSSPIGTGFTGGLGGPGVGGHVGADWYINSGMDLAAPGGTEVVASFDGHVVVFHPHDPATDSGKVYGAQIFVRDASDRMGCFYTHLADVPGHIAVGTPIARGERIGSVFEHGGIPGHVHMAVCEIFGSAADGQRVGVNLYDTYLSMGSSGSSTVVTFFQTPGQGPTASGGAPSPSPTPVPTPDAGAIDLSTLFGVQQALVALGYSPGEPDGFDGPNTQGAVAAFQSDSGLDVDGVAGPDTKAALAAALAGVGVASVGG